MSNFNSFNVDKTNLFDFSKNYFTTFSLVVNNTTLTFNLSYKYSKIYLWYANSVLTVAKSNTKFKYYIGNVVYELCFLDLDNLEQPAQELLTPDNIFSQFKIGYIS